MNIEEYISSGIIELYVLGLASPEESIQVEFMAKEHDAVREAIIENQSTMQSFANLHSVIPKPGMKAKVLEAIREQKQKTSKEQAPDEKPFISSAKMTISWKWIAAAAMILLLISLSLNWIYINRYHNTKEQYQSLLTIQQQLTADNNLLRAKMEKAEEDIQVMNNPQIKQVQLKGVPGHTDMQALVYFNNQNRRAYFGNSNLPHPPAGKEYQLWAIVDGKPVNMGMYDPAKTKGIKEMGAVATGYIEAFGVTLEKEGGVASPTMEQMYVFGKIS